MVENNGRHRVVHVVLSLNIGGLEMVVLDLVRLSNRAGFEPHVLCLNETGSLAPRIEAIRGEGRPSKRLRRELERMRRAGPG